MNKNPFFYINELKDIKDIDLINKKFNDIIKPLINTIIVHLEAVYLLIENHPTPQYNKRKTKLNYLIGIKRLIDYANNFNKKINEYHEVINGIKIPKEHKRRKFLTDIELLNFYIKKVNEILLFNDLIEEREALKNYEKVLYDTAKGYEPDFGELLDLLDQRKEASE